MVDRECNARVPTGHTVLMQAAKMADVRMVNLLLANGAEPRVSGPAGTTALHIAAKHAPLEVVELLMAYGADPGATDAQGDTARDVAERVENTSELLVAMKGSDPATKKPKLLRQNAHRVSPPPVLKEETAAGNKAAYLRAAATTTLKRSWACSCNQCRSCTINAEIECDGENAFG